MANRQIGEVPIHLDKPRILKFDLNAMCAFEDAMGITIPGLFADIADASNGDENVAMKLFGMRHVRALLWSALQHQDAALTIEDAGRLVDHATGESLDAKLVNVQEKVFEAFYAMQGSAGKKKYREMKEEISRDDGTGTKSKE